MINSDKFHIRVHKVYYETCDLFSSTKSQLYNKDKRGLVKVIILYKFVLDSNALLFDPTVPKMLHR